MRFGLWDKYSIKAEVEPPMCVPPNEPRKQNVNRHRRSKSLSVRNAYYITRPPIAPLQIAFLGERPESINDPRCMQLKKNIKTIEANNSKDVQALCLNNNTCTTPNISSKRHRGNIHLVHLILRELVNNLPLVLFSRQSSPKRNLSPGDPYLTTEKEDIVPRPEVTQRQRSSSPTDTSTVAIQTWNIISVSDCTDSGDVLYEEWLGGVRALRNSHVRLMLRQLRHIDRLNKALDHARNTGKKLVQ